MTCFTARQRLRQHMPRFLRKLGGKLLDRLDLTLELEAVKLHTTSQHERSTPAVGAVDQLAFSDGRIGTQEIVRDLRSLNRRARIAELVGEVAQLARNRPPTAAHARLRHPRFITTRSLFVDHESERQILREQCLKAT